MSLPPAHFDTRRVDPMSLGMVNATSTSRSVVALASAIQAKPEEERLVAAATFFTLICKVYDLNPLEMYERCCNLMTSHDSGHWNPEFRALRQYLQVWSDNGQSTRRDRKAELREAETSILKS